MKKVKLVVLLAAFLAGTYIVRAQSTLTIEASQQYTTFKFDDSQGNQLYKEYMGIFGGAYSIGYRYVADFGLIVKPGIGLRNSGAAMVYDDMEYSWELQYANAKLGLGYTYPFERVSPYFVASGYFGYLVSGQQVLNNEHFNITESGLLNEIDYGVIFSPGIEFKMSNYISSFLELNYLWGLGNIELDESQNSTNLAYSVTFGLSFSITKK